MFLVATINLVISPFWKAPSYMRSPPTGWTTPGFIWFPDKDLSQGKIF